MGSLRLLVRLRLQHPLSSIRAFVTVFAVGTGPTTQQIVRYYDCNILARNLTASIPRTNFYVGQGWYEDSGRNTIEPPLQVAFNAGIFSPGHSVTPKYNSGNCTFPNTYHTLGYCSSCTDISDQVRVNESTSNDNPNHTSVCYRTFSVLTDIDFSPKNITLAMSNQCGSARGFIVEPDAMTMVVMGKNNPGNITLLKGPVPDQRCVDKNQTGLGLVRAMAQRVAR